MLNTAFLLAASMVVGQAGLAAPKDHLKGLEPLIGSWIYEGPLQDVAPGLGKQGDKMIASNTYRWILDRNAIQVDWLTKINGIEVDAGRALIGWDESEQRIMEWAVTTHGSASGPWTKEGEVWTYSLTGVGPNGQESADIKYTNIGPEGYTFQLTNWKIGDAEAKQSAEYRFKKAEQPRRAGKPKARVDE